MAEVTSSSKGLDFSELKNHPEVVAQLRKWIPIIAKSQTDLIHSLLKQEIPIKTALPTAERTIVAETERLFKNLMNQ